MEHIITLLVENIANALILIASQFNGRGYIIDSISIGASEHPGLSRITMITHGEAAVVEQIIKQLKKGIDVHEVINLARNDCVKRELALVKVKALAPQQHEIMHIIMAFNGKVVDINSQSITIEVTGIESKMNAFVELLRPYGLLGVTRSGRVVVKRETPDPTPNKEQDLLSGIGTTIDHFE